MDMRLPTLIIGTVCILWFISVFETTPQFEEIRTNQEDINIILTDLNSTQDDTLFIAGYEIPMVGEILSWIGSMVNLIGSTISLTCKYIIAFFGLSAYLPIEILPIFMIFGILIVFALIAYIRLGRD